MGKKILLSCFEIPGWGGANTCLYQLFERMQREGHDVAYVNLVDEAHAPFFRYVFGEHFGNPRALAGVHTCILEQPIWRTHDGLSGLIDSYAPDLLVGFGFIAALLLREAAPRRPVVFLTAGARHVQRLIAQGAVRDFMDFERQVARGVFFPIDADDHEHSALARSDLIVLHSPLVRFAFEQLYARYARTFYTPTISVADIIYPEVEPFAALRRPFAERDIDLIFIASSWERPEKNYRLAAAIAAQRSHLRMHVIGEVATPRFPAEYHGVVSQRETLYTLLGRSKTIVCPSLVDAAPGVLFEASAMGCNIVASPNCGNSALCNPHLLAARCTRNAFLEAIDRSLGAPYPDNREQFRGGYAELVDLLSVV
jgi:glycosyltransferase involved in cell wall biosynthesis